MIQQNPELRERDVLKASQLTEVLDGLLVQRGVPPHHSRVLGRLTLLVYDQAFDDWLESGDPFTACVSAAQQQLSDTLLLASLPRTVAAVSASR